MSAVRRLWLLSLGLSLFLAIPCAADFGDTLFVAVADTANCISGENCAFGYGTASAGDLNGDGYNDIIVGNWWDDFAGEDAGAYVYFTGADMDSIPDVVFTGSAALQWLGFDVSSAGDMNGDGWDDVAIGGVRYGGDRGRVFVYWGGPDLIGEVSASDADVKITGESSLTNDGLGHDLDLVGDVNRDGLDDLLVASWYANRAYLFFGDSTLSGVVPAINADIIFDVPNCAYVSSGDFNGDGIPDFAIPNGAKTGPDGVPGAGEVYLFLGDSTFTGVLTTEDADVVITGTAQFGQLGTYLCMHGDINGDGYDDLAASAWARTSNVLNEGAVFVFHGRPSPPDSLLDTDADLIIEGDAPEIRFGYENPEVADTNGDGYDDLLVSSAWWPGYTHPERGKGRAYLFRGSPSLVGTISASRANATWEGEYMLQSFSRTLAWVPNVHEGSTGAFVFGASSFWYADSLGVLGKALVIDAGSAGTDVAVALPPSGEHIQLLPSRPNPFRDATLIRYEMPERKMVSLSVYDVGGRLVRVLESGPHGPGIQSVSWDRTNSDGGRVQSGIYFVRLRAGLNVDAQKVVIVE